MAAEESLSRLDSQVSTDASPPEINSVAQESGQTSVACGKDVHAEIDTEESNFGPLMNESSSSFWNDSCSSFDGGTWHMELEKYKNRMPSDISIDYFDVLVLYSEDNKSDARKFCDHLKKDIKLKRNKSIKAVLYDEFVPQAGPKLQLLQTALERCTYVFCYITKEFCEDKWIELSKDECLMEAIYNVEKQWCVVPVITVPIRTANFKIPIGLRCLMSIRYDQNDQYYRDNVSALIQNNLHHRLDKERKQKQQQFTWLKKNIALHFGNEDIGCPENKEKMRTKQQEKEKSREKAVNEDLIRSQPVFLQKAEVQTGTDAHKQPGGTSFERRINDNLDCRGQCGESTSEENEPTCNNSIKSTDQLSHGGNTNHMEPVSEILTSGNTSYMPQLDGPNSTMASSSINSCTGEKMPIQEEGCTGATSDMQTDSDHSEPLSRGISREGTDTDNGYHSDQSVEPVGQKNDPSDNICIKSADQLYQGGSTNHMQPVVHKFAGNGNQSDTPLLDGQDSAVHSYSSINSYTGEKRHIQEQSSTGARFADCLQDIGCLSLNPDVDAMYTKSDDQSQDNQMTPVNQSPSCWGTKATVEEEREQSLETKSKDHSMPLKKIKEEKEHYSSLSEKEFAMEMNKKDQDFHFVSRVKDSKEKLVATVTPRLKVCKNRDGEKTDLDIVARETNGDTQVKTIHETREPTLHETGLEETLPKIVDEAVSKISPCRERPHTDLSQYQVNKKPAAPLLTRASSVTPFAAKMTLMQRNSTPAKHIESDELD